MRKMKRFLALTLAATMTLSSMSVTSFAAMISERPADGETKDQPFAPGTGDSQNFRIPCLVTLDDGTIVAGCDARWNHASDACGLDTIISRSTDGGKTWNYTFANYLGDNGNKFDYNSTAFIDPAMATDGETIWLVADLYPAGVAINTVPSNKTARPGHTGYTADGELALAKATDSVNGYSTSDARANASLYTYHLEKIEGAADDAESFYQIVDANGNVDDTYTVDAYFNIKGDGVDTNLFIIDSPYFPFPTDFLYMTKSEDGGATWSIPTLMDVKKATEQTLLVGPGRGIVTSTGRLIFTCYDFTYADDRSACLYSDDGGETWTRGADVANWSSEAVVTEAEGKLYMFTRHGNCYYISEDWGETWGPAISVDPAYNSNCQLSAITYSEKIDGKTAIILSAPSNTSSRSEGKLFLGLIQEDGTLEWVNEYKVTDGAYAYSCLDELNNGNIALLYESAGSAITYKELDIKEVLGLVKNLDLSLGSKYIEEKAATSAPEIIQAPDEKVATATSQFVVEESSTVLHNHVANSAQNITGSFNSTANDSQSIADCEFTFTASGDKWHVTSEKSGNAVIITNASTYFGNTPADVTVTKLDTENPQFRLSIYDSSKATNRYMVFYDTNMVFDAWGTNDVSSVTRTDVHFDLVLFEKQEEVSADDIIPGYAIATEVKDGGKYLITYLWDDSILVLYPANGQANQTKLVGETKTVAKSIVTIEAVGIGETTAVIGDVTYNINVPDPKEDPSYDEADYAVDKITYSTGSEQPVSGNEGPVSFAFDNNTNTFWHSSWSPTWNPSDCADHLWVEMALEEATVVDAVRFLTRGGNGDVTGYRVTAKTTESGDEWVTLTEGTWTRGGSEWKLAQFEPTEVTAVRIIATETYADSGNNKFASAREIRLRTAELADVNYREILDAKIVEYGAFKFNDYEIETARALVAAVMEAMVIAKNPDATQEELKATIEHLDEVYAALVPKCTHAETEVINAKEATCTETGYTGDTVCKNCGAEITKGKETSALGHTWGEWTIVKEATTEEEGLKERICSVCGEKEETTIEKLPVVAPVNPFADVIEGQYYYDPVLWAVENKVTSGLNETTFGVGSPCTREQIVTFLWNYAGQPEATQTECTFEDVNPEHYYYKAMLWANEKGYVSGYNQTQFGVGDPCTREQIVMILWKYAGEPTATSDVCNFEDADAEHYYYDAMLWAVEKGVVAGYSETEFGVGDACTREQIVTFLYRYNAL